MTTLFTLLTIAGLMLIGAEVFIPGGVLGVFGAISLIAAGVIAFMIFSPAVATAIAFGMILMVGIVIALWISIFPRTYIGREMTVSNDLKSSKGTEDDLQELLGKTGITRSSLRPAGYIEIGGRRIDVVTQGEMIDIDTPVRVTEIAGNRVIVETLSE